MLGSQLYHFWKFSTYWCRSQENIRGNKSCSP